MRYFYPLFLTFIEFEVDDFYYLPRFEENQQYFWPFKLYLKSNMILWLSVGGCGFSLNVPRTGPWNSIPDPSETGDASFRYVEN